jgi:hypothetical protein
MYKAKPFDQENHEKFLKHEDIENLSGLEIDLVYEWELGSMLIFDRTRLHCSSSNIDGKKIGLTTFTKKIINYGNLRLFFNILMKIIWLILDLIF